MSREFRIGLFVVSGLLIFSIGVFLIGSKDLLFNSTYPLKSEFKNVQGLNNGAEVRVGGIHQGTVQRIELPSENGAKVTVVMRLRNQTRRVLKKDSVASIKTEGLLGDKFVEISFGSAKAAGVENGDVLPGEAPRDITEQAQATADEARAAVASFRDNMQALQHNFLLRGFFEKRGYNDPSELNRDAISRIPSRAPSRQFEFEAMDLFDKPDNAKLKNRKRLDDAGHYLEENSFTLAIVASSESLGDTKKDRVLTKARAKVIRDYLVGNFKVDDTRIRTIGLGKTRDSDDAGKVTIFVYETKPGDSPSS